MRWENVALGTDRLEVPGGWLYMVEIYGSVQNTHQVVFVPKPEPTYKFDED